MNGYSWVSVISLCCYLFLLVTFLAAEKSKKVLYTFMGLLAVMILWNGGSFCMRMQLWPSVYLWHHVSLLGMVLLPVGYYHFVLDFLEEKNGCGKTFWTVFYLLMFTINCVTGFFVPLPEVVTSNGKAQFIYHYNWHIYLLYLFVVLTLVQLALIIRRHCMGNRIAFRQLVPVICGVAIMIVGHGLATLPVFAGIPVDIVSGVFNAIFLFYALYKKRLFRMTLLLSKSNYCILAMVLGVGVFSKFALNFEHFLSDRIGLGDTFAMLIITMLLAVIIVVLYLIINKTLDGIFVRSEQKQSALIERFGEEITHMLSVDAILQGLSDTIQEAIHVDRIFVFIRDLDGQYRIEHTTNPLEEKNFYVRSDHPLVAYFKTHSGCVIQQEFARTTIYRSMWEKEKLLLKTLDIECFVPLMAEDDLIGLVMLAGKKDKKPYQPADMRFLQSICGICAGAVKNAYTYERALEGARKDSLTNLVNRKFFFELLEREFEKHKDTALSLCLLNVDDFKLYNQLYGTQEGNLALQRVAGILAASVNESGYAARIGGKEFALILPGYDIYSAKCLAENVAAQIGEINHYSNGETASRLTVSVGICAAPYMASSAKELFKNADTAVYTVKRSGKNAVLMYSAEISRRENRHSKYKSGYSEHASTIYALTAAIDTKDHYTFQHSQNVAYYASELAKAAGMGPDLVEIVKEAALLHDIGKIGVREDILNKPGKLTQEEYEIMKGHVENAVNIIRYLPSLDYVIPTVLSHHERYDGRGYPRRLAGEEIPIMGRVLCIADAFDAITSVRSYKNAASPQEAVRILREEAGKQFDPNLVTVFTELVEEDKIEMQEQHPSMPSPPPMPPVDEGIQPPDDSDEAFFKNRDQDPEIQD